MSLIWLLASSFLLWRACTSLAARGDRVMAWHRRFHGIALIAALLLAALSAGLGFMLWASFERGYPPPTAGEQVLAFSVGGVIIVMVLGSCGLNVMQWYSTVVAFKTLRRA